MAAVWADSLAAANATGRVLVRVPTCMRLSCASEGVCAASTRSIRNHTTCARPVCLCGPTHASHPPWYRKRARANTWVHRVQDTTTPRSNLPGAGAGRGDCGVGAGARHARGAAAAQGACGSALRTQLHSPIVHVMHCKWLTIHRLGCDGGVLGSEGLQRKRCTQD